MRIRYLEPMYGFGTEHSHVAVAAPAEAKLREMAARLVGTEDLIAIYIPLGTNEVWEAGSQRGRVVGAVQLVEMPPERNITDYFYDDWDGTRRWPVGWPCRVVYAPPTEQAPVLRDLVEFLHGAGNFQPYVARLQHGPIDLDAKMATELMNRFRPFKLAS